MSAPAIELHRVAKRFTIHHNPARTLKESVLRFLSFKRAEEPEAFWSLRDITMQIRVGESVGLIGPNGSGKSTLLYLIAGTMLPTHGDVVVRGQVAPLIELGLGFHPELTGKENVFLNASLYGLTRAEVEAIYPAIVQFSELERFVDAPVKTYSSGMYMRLGFSVAVHLDPDILLIDEVLAVGDERFQEKCMDTMRELRNREKTIILVSHNLDTIESMCDRAYLLTNGEVREEGDVSQVVAQCRSREMV